MPQPFFVTVFLQVVLLVFGLVISSSSNATPSRHFPEGVRNVTITAQNDVRSDLLNNIAPIIEHSISEGAYPGAVVLAVHHGHVIYRGVFGNKRIVPEVAPMSFDTIFDLASLTKVLVTTPAVMQLVEKGKLELDAPVEKYWRAFGVNGKSAITVRELLTHTSGLTPDIPDPLHPSTNPSWHGEKSALTQIAQLKLTNPPGTTFLYSDVNFIILGYLVELISGEPLDKYAEQHIFKPLNLHNTFYKPRPDLRDRIAPTEIIEKELRWGNVQDGTANAMGGVSGNAGVFADASDLGAYAQCLLDGGRLTHTAQKGKKKSGFLLGPLAILKMTTPQSPPNITEIRGLGWDIDSVYSGRGVFFPVRSFGHTGWTGTSLWIDPVTQTYLIILTSRTHPTPAVNNQVIHDRRVIAGIVAASLTDVSVAKHSNTGENELTHAYLSANKKN